MKKITQFISLMLLVIFAHNTFATTKTHKEPLPAEQAFQLTVDISTTEPVVHFKMAKGYYLYRERTIITALPQQDVTANYPKGSFKENSNGVKIEILEGSIDIPIKLKSPAEQLLIHYQGCSADGFCYPPSNRTITLVAATGGTNASPSQPNMQPSLLNDQHGVAHLLASGNYFAILGVFLLLGLLLAFTPCVLPMIPILAGIIVGQQHISTRKAFFLSLTYVLGTSLTYAGAGVLAAYMGKSLQVWLQTPIVIISVSLIFLLLALSLFGLFELRLPARFQARVTNMSNTLSGGTYVGVFGMGVLSTLIVSPCVTAPLVGVLLYISESGNIMLGASVLFAIGIGMGIPLLLVGVSAGKWLPKRGAWMEVVKKSFGVVMLLMAVWLLSRILSSTMAVWVWKACLVALLIAIGGYFPRLLGRQHFHRYFGLLAGCCGVLILASGINIPVLSAKPVTQATVDSAFKVVHTLSDIRTQIAIAKSLNKPVLLDFYADWCESCLAMDKNVFAKKQIQQMLSQYVMLRADLTANNAQDQAILEHFGVIAPPTVLFFDNQGKELDDKRIVGEVDVKEFLTRIKNEG